MIRSKRTASLVVSAAALVIILGAAAWACTNHTGNIYFCTTSSSCSQTDAITPRANATAYVDGVSLAASTAVTIRYAATTNPDNDGCHTGTSLGSGTTDSSGNIVGTVTVTTPGSGNWTFCATNAGTNYSNHLALTLS